LPDCDSAFAVSALRGSGFGAGAAGVCDEPDACDEIGAGDEPGEGADCEGDETGACDETGEDAAGGADPLPPGGRDPAAVASPVVVAAGGVWSFAPGCVSFSARVRFELDP
jgi:hypothetical protein